MSSHSLCCEQAINFTNDHQGQQNQKVTLYARISLKRVTLHAKIYFRRVTLHARISFRKVTLCARIRPKRGFQDGGGNPDQLESLLIASRKTKNQRCK